MPFDTLLQIMFSVLFMMALGFVLSKKNILDEGTTKKLSSMLLYVVVPCNIMAVGNATYAPHMVGQLGWTAVVAGIYYIVAYVSMYGMGRAMRLNTVRRNSFINLVVLANISYIAFPIVLQLYGAEGGLYAVVYNLVFSMFGYSIGITLAGGRPTAKQFFTRPISLAPILSILLFISPLRLPGALVTTLEQVGAMTAPFSLFIIGAAMARVPFKSIFSNALAWLVTLLRQVVAPAITAAILYFAGFKGILPATLVVLAGMPSATLNVIFAEQYDRDIPMTSQAVVQGTLLMAISLPVQVLLCARLFM